MRTFVLIFILLPAFWCDAQQTKSAVQVDACSLLSVDRVKEIMQEPVQPGKQIGADKPQPGAMDAAISNCTWESVARSGNGAKESISLWVRRAPAAVNDSAQVMEEFRKDPETGAAREVQGIAGFGDLAFWISEKEGNRTRVEVDAMKKDVIVRVVMTGVESPAAAEAEARSIIEGVWEKLAVK